MFRLGIIGCGNIAAKMAETCLKTEGVELYAVAARDKEKADEFARSWGAKASYGSYSELFSDKNVDLVYVATITSLHHEHMMEALNAGKPVLCEKSFCVNRAEAEEVFNLARKKKLFAGEAIWTRYMPARKLIDSIIKDKTIGRITSISANLGYTISKKPRIEHPALGGGAMLDISVYPINFALMALGDKKIVEQSGVCFKNEFGADIKETMDMISEDGVMISLYADTETLTDRRGIIYGTDGRIVVDNVNEPLKIEVFTFDGRKVEKKEEHNLRHEATGFEYELLDAKEAIESGALEPRGMSWETSLNVLSIMDRFRERWGVLIGSELKN